MLPPPQPSPPRGRRWFRVAVWLAWAGAALAGYALYTGQLTLPPRYDAWYPWIALDPMAEPNPVTPYKLARARSDPARCQAALALTSLQYDPVPDRQTGEGCGFDNAVRLRAAPVRFGPPLPLSCPMALSFAMWERHALQPAAEAHFGERVVALDSLGSYACRNVNRGEGAARGKAATFSGARSRHATADALDIAGFTLAGGRHITVLRQWKQPAAPRSKPPSAQPASSAAASTPAAGPALTADARWLQDAHDGACRYFEGVLGPDYNAVHRDHFHLETGGYGMCR
ncbi:MAG: extensin family protein [Comamonadaceae bacterium]|nr:MAG: extensin family protein [Comamonadaceae bacterium]